MSFLQPLFLAGIVAAALPLIIHLINRRKAVRRQFPAMKLLRESNERIARSVKVRQWLLLALRVLAIALLALALAKPFVFSSEGMTADERLPTAVVFVVENGVAMDYDDWFDRARDELDDEIGQLRPWDEAALVATAEDEPVVQELTSEHRDVASAGDDLQVRYHSGELSNALLDADDMLAGSQLPNRRIVVIGSNTDAPVQSPRDLRLASPVDYIGVGDADVDNLAVTDVEYQQRGAARDGNWTIQTVVTNLGTTDREGVELRLLIDDQTVAATAVDVPAGESVTRSFDHHVERAHLREGVVEIDADDGLEADDRWHFALQPQHRARTLLVNGSPSSVPHDDELFFLTRALEPLRQSSTGFSLSETTADGLADRDLDDYDVVVLANVSSLSSELTGDLERFVESGGGLFISMGDEIDEDAYNDQFDALLPRPLRGRKRLAERDDPDAPVKTTRLGHPRRQHPVFRSFDTPGTGILQSVSVYTYMLLDPAPSDRDAEVLLSYQDNAPALLERNVGRGRVLLFTSSLDHDWTDFPIRSAYLPLINRSLMHLARRAHSDTDDHNTVGESIALEAGDLIERRAIIRAPDGGRHVIEPLDGIINYTPKMPGIHSIYADDEQQANHLESLTIAANVDRQITAFDEFPHATLQKWAGEDDDILSEGTGSPEERRVNLWSYLLFVVTLVLLAETVLGARRSVLMRTFEAMAFWRDNDDSGPIDQSVGTSEGGRG